MRVFSGVNIWSETRGDNLREAGFEKIQFHTSFSFITNEMSVLTTELPK